MNNSKRNKPSINPTYKIRDSITTNTPRSKSQRSLSHARQSSERRLAASERVKLRGVDYSFLLDDNGKVDENKVDENAADCYGVDEDVNLRSEKLSDNDDAAQERISQSDVSNNNHEELINNSAYDVSTKISNKSTLSPSKASSSTTKTTTTTIANNNNNNDEAQPTKPQRRKKHRKKGTSARRSLSLNDAYYYQDFEDLLLDYTNNNNDRKDEEDRVSLTRVEGRNYNLNSSRRKSVLVPNDGNELLRMSSSNVRNDQSELNATTNNTNKSSSTTATRPRRRRGTVSMRHPSFSGGHLNPSLGGSVATTKTSNVHHNSSRSGTVGSSNVGGSAMNRVSSNSRNATTSTNRGKPNDGSELLLSSALDQSDLSSELLSSRYKRKSKSTTTTTASETATASEKSLTEENVQHLNEVNDTTTTHTPIRRRRKRGTNVRRSLSMNDAHEYELDELELDELSEHGHRGSGVEMEELWNENDGGGGKVVEREEEDEVVREELLGKKSDEVKRLVDSGSGSSNSGGSGGSGGGKNSERDSSKRDKMCTAGPDDAAGGTCAALLERGGECLVDNVVEKGDGSSGQVKKLIRKDKGKQEETEEERKKRRRRQKQQRQLRRLEERSVGTESTKLHPLNSSDSDDDCPEMDRIYSTPPRNESRKRPQHVEMPLPFSQQQQQQPKPSQESSTISNNSIMDDYIQLKLKVAELQSELQHFQSETSSYKLKLFNYQKENEELRRENQLMRDGEVKKENEFMKRILYNLERLGKIDRVDELLKSRLDDDDDDVEEEKRVNPGWTGSQHKRPVLRKAHSSRSTRPKWGEEDWGSSDTSISKPSRNGPQRRGSILFRRLSVPFVPTRKNDNIEVEEHPMTDSAVNDKRERRRSFSHGSLPSLFRWPTEEVQDTSSNEATVRLDQSDRLQPQPKPNAFGEAIKNIRRSFSTKDARDNNNNNNVSVTAAIEASSNVNDDHEEKKDVPDYVHTDEDANLLQVSELSSDVVPTSRIPTMGGGAASNSNVDIRQAAKQESTRPNIRGRRDRGIFGSFIREIIREES